MKKLIMTLALVLSINGCYAGTLAYYDIDMLTYQAKEACKKQDRLFSVTYDTQCTQRVLTKLIDAKCGGSKASAKKARKK